MQPVGVGGVAGERSRTRFYIFAGAEASASLESWLSGLTHDIYADIKTRALVFVGAVTECHFSVNAPDTSVGLHKVCHYTLLCI